VCATLTLFAVALFLGLGPSVVRVLFGDKWMPALPMLYAFAVVSMVAFISPIMNGALDALGKPQVMMRLGIGWTILNWVACTVAMHIRSGALSFTIGYCVHILAGNLAVVFVIKQLIPDTRIWPKIRTAMLAGLGAATLSRWGFLPWAGGPLTLAAAVVATIATFVTLLALVDRSALRELLAMLRNRLRREMIR
jgi:O-antigen/teichoic acid export membrane protein